MCFVIPESKVCSDVMCVFLFVSSCANPADQTVTVEENGLGTSNYFSFHMFQFSGSSGDLYLHCKLNVCVKQNQSCAPVSLLHSTHTHS